MPRSAAGAAALLLSAAVAGRSTAGLELRTDAEADGRPVKAAACCADCEAEGGAPLVCVSCKHAPSLSRADESPSCGKTHSSQRKSLQNAPTQTVRKSSCASRCRYQSTRSACEQEGYLLSRCDCRPSAASHQAAESGGHDCRTRNNDRLDAARPYGLQRMLLSYRDRRWIRAVGRSCQARYTKRVGVQKSVAVGDRAAGRALGLHRGSHRDHVSCSWSQQVPCGRVLVCQGELGHSFSAKLGALRYRHYSPVQENNTYFATGA